VYFYEDFNKMARDDRIGIMGDETGFFLDQSSILQRVEVIDL
jgi:hypothetical protein